MLGKLTLDAIPLHEPILVVTMIMVALGGLGLFAALTYFRTVSYTHLTLPTTPYV